MEHKRDNTRAACAVCGSRRLRPLPAYRRAHLVRCRDCGLVFAGRDPSEEELARNYGEYSREDADSPLTRQRYRELLDRFEPYRRTGRILDMGCGIGYFLEEAERRGWEAHGSEFEPRAVEIVRGKGLRCLQAPLHADSLEPGSFDVITAFEVVEHLREPQAEAATIAAALRPGGLFYCTTPNFGSLSRRLLRARWRVIAYPEHLSYFTPRPCARGSPAPASLPCGCRRRASARPTCAAAWRPTRARAGAPTSGCATSSRARAPCKRRSGSPTGCWRRPAPATRSRPGSSFEPARRPPSLAQNRVDEHNLHTDQAVTRRTGFRRPYIFRSHNYRSGHHFTSEAE